MLTLITRLPNAVVGLVPVPANIAAEVAKHVTGASTKQQIARMRILQKTMGDIHDLQTYMAALVEWSGKR